MSMYTPAIVIMSFATGTAFGMFIVSLGLGNPQAWIPGVGALAFFAFLSYLIFRDIKENKK